MKWYRRYSLSIVLLALFLGSWGLQTWMGWVEFRAEQQAHGEVAHIFGSGGYLWAWGQATFENWQSEFLQLFSFVVLASVLIHKGSPQSKDGQDELKDAIERIELRLADLSRAQRSVSVEQSVPHVNGSYGTSGRSGVAAHRG